MNRLELLSPAGDYERFCAALLYGADAIYLGASDFTMRARSNSFDDETIKKAVSMAHEKRVRVYLTVNTTPLSGDIDALPQFIKRMAECGVDAFIVADIGVMSICKEIAPDIEIHISTQAGVTNYRTAQEFYKMGARRVVLARELSLDDIKNIRENTPDDLEIECFVHGAICMSFSGRCLISNYMIGRDANDGKCAQPCRWGYHLVEEKRPNDYYPIFEDEAGSYILNAKDLCMIEHLDKVLKAGVNSFKIEGRAKSTYYTAVVTNAYKQALEILKNDPDNYNLPQYIIDEVRKVSHRRYDTGFYFGKPIDGQYYESGGYFRDYDVVAIVQKYENGRIFAGQRNKFSVGEELEVVIPGGAPIAISPKIFFDEKGNEVSVLPHAMQNFSFDSDIELPVGAMIRAPSKK